MFQTFNKVSTPAVVAALSLLFAAMPALAIIRGGEGNQPIDDPGWPAGAAAVFNSPARVAYWEGPPLGGGQWHAECRGDAQALNAVLADLSKMEAKSKRVVLRDGVGRSVWLNPNRAAAKNDAAKVDWVFMVWQPASWERQRNMPGALVPPDVLQVGDDPPTQITVYTGGNVRWANVMVPDGIVVVDERLETHGFSLDDGAVAQGKVVDLATNRPIAAQVKLERSERKPEGGNQYTTVSDAAVDAQGGWVLKNVPPGMHRIVLEANGYVPRIVGYVYGDEPGWHFFDVGLLRPVTVSGQVRDALRTLCASGTAESVLERR